MSSKIGFRADIDAGSLLHHPLPLIMHIEQPECRKVYRAAGGYGPGYRYLRENAVAWH